MRQREWRDARGRRVKIEGNGGHDPVPKEDERNAAEGFKEEKHQKDPDGLNDNEYEIDTMVMLHGLQEGGLNGLWGRIEAWSPERMRYTVHLEGGRKVSVKAGYLLTEEKGERNTRAGDDRDRPARAHGGDAVLPVHGDDRGCLARARGGDAEPRRPPDAPGASGQRMPSPMALKPDVLWAQWKDSLYVTIDLKEAQNMKVSLEAEGLVFSGQVGVACTSSTSGGMPNQEGRVEVMHEDADINLPQEGNGEPLAEAERGEGKRSRDQSGLEEMEGGG